MELEQNYMIYKTGDFQEKWNAYISLLYKPLIENDACMLYDFKAKKVVDVLTKNC